MCGVFGYVLGNNQSASKQEIKQLLQAVFKQSYSRGKEASGIAFRSHDRLSLFKEAMSSRDLIKNKHYNNWLDAELDRLSDAQGNVQGPISILGHARLMTNGMQGIKENNQPVRTDTTIAVHNGIIVNEAEITKNHKDITRTADVDSELIPLLADKYVNSGEDLQTALSKIFDEVLGQVTTIIMRTDRPWLLVGTNFGSLYAFVAPDSGAFLCMSERVFLEDARKESSLLQRDFNNITPVRVPAGEGYLVDEDAESAPIVFQGPEKSLATPNISPSSVHSSVKLFDEQLIIKERRDALRRCTECVLPETMPGISFNDEGVCSFCERHEIYTPKGVDALYEALKPYRRTDGAPELVMGLSGGRDSSYGVHYVRKELGINLVTYTYDWALVTDLARRNTSRICHKLELEHVLVSADIKKKRSYIRDNINAWLRDPQLGMIPLFMAGDKHYFYYYDVVKKRMGLDLAISCGNRFEKTDFKSGFCGVHNTEHGEVKNWHPYNISVFKKMKYLGFFAWHMGKNPGYWNGSIPDNLKGFYASYILDHNFIWLFDYIPWEEDVINNTLAEEYDWETASDTESTWRVGDGTSSFYNYIYLTAAGFSEHDTFRSNQIRDKVMTREEAMRLVKRDNTPRYETILEYSNLIGFDFDAALAAINQMPKLY